MIPPTQTCVLCPRPVRILGIIFLLSKREAITGPALARKLKVSVSSIHGDMKIFVKHRLCKRSGYKGYERTDRFLPSGQAPPPGESDSQLGKGPWSVDRMARDSWKLIMLNILLLLIIIDSVPKKLICQTLYRISWKSSWKSHCENRLNIETSLNWFFKIFHIGVYVLFFRIQILGFPYKQRLFSIINL